MGKKCKQPCTQPNSRVAKKSKMQEQALSHHDDTDLMVVEAIKTKELEAASLLSRKWRNQWQFHMKKLAGNYLLAGPSIKHVKSIR